MHRFPLSLARLYGGNVSRCSRPWHVLFVVFLLFGPVLAQPDRSLETVLTDLAANLAQHFPTLRGEVVQVDGEQITLNVGVQDAILAGMQLDVWREGETLAPPTTGTAVGQLEEELGTLTVVHVFPDHSIAQRVDPTETRAIHVGDQVRLSAGRIAVGLLPTTGRVEHAVPSPTLEADIAQALDATGRFRTLPADRTRIWLLERDVPITAPLAPALFPELAQALQVSYLVMPHVQDVQGQATLELALLSPFQEIPIVAPTARLPQSALVQETPPPLLVPPPPTPSQTLPSPAPAPVASPPLEQRLAWLFEDLHGVQPDSIEWNFSTTLVEIHRLPERIQGLDAGDVDADGQNEVAIVTDSRVMLYRLQEERLELLGTSAPVRQGSLMSVQLLRVGQELGVVVNHYRVGHGMDAYILTLQGQQLVPWQDGIPAILLAIDGDGDGTKETVWSQPFDRQWFFQRGRVQQWLLTSEGLVAQDKLAMPFAFRATGAALMQLDAGEPRTLVFVDEQHQLQVYSDEEKVWNSAPGIGGSYASASLVRFLTNGDTQNIPVFFDGIPAILDVDGNGTDEALLPRNLGYLRVTPFDTIIPHPTRVAHGDIVLLQHLNDRFTLRPISPRFKGVVSGLAALPGRLPRVVVGISRRQGIVGQQEDTILFLARIPPAAATVTVRPPGTREEG